MTLCVRVLKDSEGDSEFSENNITKSLHMSALSCHADISNCYWWLL